MSHLNCTCAWNPDSHAIDCPVRHHQYLSTLATKCQGIAGTLSYDADEDATKRALHDASHALDSESVRVYRFEGVMHIENARGKRRWMTFRERLAMWLLRGRTEIRP